MSIKHPKVTVLMLLVHLGTQSFVQCINIFTLEFLVIKVSGAVNPNTPHSPPVCTMFNETAQYLKFFHVFFQCHDNGVSVIMMTSS